MIAVGCSGTANSRSDNTDAPRSAFGVMSGPIEEIEESVGIFVWGLPSNQLCQQWSVAVYERSGWFYGSDYFWSSADVFVLKAPEDPLSVAAAEDFEFTSASVEAHEGDTVFFRGKDGSYGAWAISDIEGREDAVLYGRWYFKPDGGGDFTGPIVAGGASQYATEFGVCSEN